MSDYVEYEPTASELGEVAAANRSGRPPVVFVHGLWLLDSSWDRWAAMFEEAGYAAVTPGWPDDPPDVEAARDDPSVFANKSVGDVAAYQQRIIERLDRKPALIGHSFGGLLVQILAGRGLSAATVAIDPAPSRGVLPLPAAALKASAPVLTNPANRHRAVSLTFEQFRFGFANAVTDEEAQQLYDEFHVAGSGVPVFQAAFANVNPRSETKVDNLAADRGPMLVTAGEMDHQVPPAISRATYERQAKNEDAVTEYVEIPKRGHSLTIDSGWQEVAQTCLDFVDRFARTAG
ncbi:pimeloyl-ACP methyl ester carboxylesterase [Mumia flava]|uniref:Pimeloyl-ACP methyl ester carboxylesterase n=1 Tax=Mumia flava TaxID=1348852 RepID=A0A0B2BV57_9ACTN|nr:alpha/beta hydrolase [Mumia flava]PJJ54210.1 pimeloyl-ACP methyl ester carboxylesterase [Mumia flava]